MAGGVFEGRGIAANDDPVVCATRERADIRSRARQATPFGGGTGVGRGCGLVGLALMAPSVSGEGARFGLASDEIVS